MYADYTFYTGSFYGTEIAEADFPRLASKASDFLDYYTQGRAAASEETEALAKACCAVAEQMQADERAKALAAKAASEALAGTGGEVKSETVGSWSQSYTTAADYARASTFDAWRDANEVYASAALHYLYNTGLLYRGCRR